jgi:hypothetical protein
VEELKRAAEAHEGKEAAWLKEEAALLRAHAQQAAGLEEQVARLETEVRRALPLSYPGHKAFQPLVEYPGFY